MTRNQENKMTMYLVVVAWCQQNLAGVNLPAFSSAFTTFLSVVQAIQAKRGVQEYDSKGVTVGKDSDAERLIKIAVKVRGALLVYAKAVGNNALHGSVKSYSRTKLEQSRDTFLWDRCSVIFTQATAHIANLANYGVTPAMLTDFNTKLGAFALSLPAPGTERSKKAGATRTIAQLMQSADEVLLERMDPLMPILEDVAYNFWQGYQNARVIIDLRGPGNQHYNEGADLPVDGGDGGPVGAPDEPPTA